MDELNDIKRMWEGLNQRLSSVEEENNRLMRMILRGKYRSARDKLERKYQCFIFIEFIMTLAIPLILYNTPDVNETYRLPTVIFCIALFIAEAILDYYLLKRLRKIDIYNSPVATIAEMARENVRLHKRGIIIGLPFAFILVVLYALCFNANIYVLYGIITGAIVGLTIGLFQLRKFLSYYRQLETESSLPL